MEQNRGSGNKPTHTWSIHLHQRSKWMQWGKKSLFTYRAGETGQSHAEAWNQSLPLVHLYTTSECVLYSELQLYKKHHCFLEGVHEMNVVVMARVISLKQRLENQICSVLNPQALSRKKRSIYNLTERRRPLLRQYSIIPYNHVRVKSFQSCIKLQIYRKVKEKKKFKLILSYLKLGFWNTVIKFSYLILTKLLFM